MGDKTPRRPERAGFPDDAGGKSEGWSGSGCPRWGQPRVLEPTARALPFLRYSVIIFSMDVFFVREAALFLQALPLAGLNPGSGGLLIGHKRGQRFIVEKIFPAQKAFFSSLDHYFRLNDLFEGKIIGFFSFGLDKANIQKILKPFACGKLYLEIRPNRKETLNMRPYVIEYSKSFFLQRIHLHPQPKEAK